MVGFSLSCDLPIDTRLSTKSNQLVDRELHQDSEFHANRIRHGICGICWLKLPLSAAVGDSGSVGNLPQIHNGSV